MKMKSFVISFLSLFVVSFTYAQSADLGSPTTISTPFYTTGTEVMCYLDAALPSGLATMDGAPGTDDVFMSFVAETQGVSIDCTSADFDMVLELWEGADLVASSNSVVGTGGEDLWVTGLTPGNEYIIRVYSVDGAGTGTFTYLAERLPAVHVRDFYSPTNATFDTNDGVPGYRLNQIIARENVNMAGGFDANLNDFIEATEYKFTNTATGDVHFREVLGVSGGLTLNSVIEGGLLCPNEEYDVQVQVKLDGNYCGFAESLPIFTEPVPTGTVNPGWGNQEYPITGNIQMDFIGQGQEITWYLETNNGETVLDPYTPANPANTWLTWDDLPCVRYGKSYEVRVQATYCGIEGPISDPIVVFIEPYPKTKLIDSQFSAGAISPVELVICDNVYKADQYAFQFAPITPGDPNMIPIGPASIAYSSTTSTFLGPLGLEVGATYRAGVKSFIQFSDGCNDPQESDYGLFAELLIDDSLEPVDELDDFSDVDTDGGSGGTNAQSGYIKDYSSTHSQKVFVVDIKEQGLSGTGVLRVFDLNGRLVLTKNIFKLEEADYLLYDLSNELATGSYIFNLTANEKNLSEKIHIP